MMKASSSRFIALMGTVVILILYVGFGLACLYRFSSVHEIPDMTKVANFFYSGLVLLAPYLINTFSSVFSILKPQSSTGVRRLAGCKAHKYPDGIVAFFVLGCGCR
jgi:hypothetical protein